MTLIFYDLLGTNASSPFSPYTFRTRYTLNLKGIPYKTEWVEYPDIEPLCKKFGISPTSKNADGSDCYTIPPIHDPSTGVYISDSVLIAEYLDKTYPYSSQVFPHHTHALHAAFTAAFENNLGGLWKFIVPATYAMHTPRSQEYVRRTMEKFFGKALEDVAPKGEYAVAEWAQFRDGMGRVDAWYAKNGGKGPFLLGETPSWGDIVVCSYLIWLRVVWGEDSQQWKDISSWNDGRWAAIIKALKKYEY